MNQQSFTPVNVPATAMLSSSAPSSGQALTPKFLIGVVRRWWKISVALGIVLSAAAGTALLLLHHPSFEASTWMRIKPSYLVFKDEGDRQTFVQTQKELIKSPPVISEALSHPEVIGLPIFVGIEDRVEWLRRQIQAQPVGMSELFLISLESRHQDSVARVVNAVREAYLATLNTEVARQNESTLMLLEAERSRRFVEIQNDRDRLRELIRQQEGPAAAAASANSKMTAVVTSAPSPGDVLQQQLSGVEMDMVLNQVELQTLQDTPPPSEANITSSVLDQAVEQQPAVLAALAEVDRLQQQLIELESVTAPTSSRLTRLRESVTLAQTKLEDAKSKATPLAATELLKEAKRGIEEQIKERQARHEQLELMAGVLKKKVEDARKNSQSRGQNSLEAQFLQEDLARKESVYSRIVDRIEAIKTESRAQSRVTTLQEATTPIRPKDSKILLMGAAGVVGLFFLPIACFVFWEYRRRPINEPQELSSASNLNVFGEVTALPTRSRLLPGGEKRFEESLRRFEESIHYLRTTIQLSQHRERLKSLVICSASPREGKSTIAAHLASSLANASLGRVLLIDADMRRPSLHRLFDQPLENGLVDYLDGRITADEVLRETWTQGLDFVSAGVLDTSVFSLLSTNRLENFIRQMEEVYEFVIIDVPPILPVSDGLVIGRLADAAVLCVLRDRSTLSGVAKAAQRLREANVNLIGSVYNGAPSNSYGSAYEYYYSSGQPGVTAPV